MARRRRQDVAEEALLHFQVLLPAEGFRLVDGKDVNSGTRGRFVIDPLPIGDRGDTWRYDPLSLRPPPSIAEEPLAKSPSSLFRTFAGLGSEADSILTFAKQYGLLRGDTAVDVSGERHMFFGDPVSLWSDEVAEMREVLDLWFALQDGDTEMIEKRISVKKQRRTVVATHSRTKDRVKVGHRIVIDARDAFHDPMIEQGARLAAVLFIRKIVNQRLQEDVGGRLLYLTKDSSDGQKSRLPLTFRLVPRNLLGALWLQLARAIDEGKEYRRCKMCPTRIEISLDGSGSRSDRETCSKRCRKAAQRKREDLARAMRAKGKRIKQIADALGMKTETVKKAIAKPKRPRGRPRKV